MCEVRLAVLKRIEVQFVAQKGTGYHGWMEHLGCRCALAAGADTHSFDVARMRLESRGLDLGAIEALADIHDTALGAAFEGRMDGIEGLDDKGRFPMVRARIGTPAYDYVWGKLKEWAEKETVS